MKTFKDFMSELTHISAVPNSKGEYEKVHRPSVNSPVKKSTDVDLSKISVGNKYRNKDMGQIHSEITDIGKKSITVNRLNRNGNVLQQGVEYTHKEFFKKHEI